MLIYVDVIDVIVDNLRFGNSSYDVTVDENIVTPVVIATLTASSGQRDAVIGYHFDEFTIEQYGQVSQSVFCLVNIDAIDAFNFHQVYKFRTMRNFAKAI